MGTWTVYQTPLMCHNVGSALHFNPKWSNHSAHVHRKPPNQSVDVSTKGPRWCPYSPSKLTWIQISIRLEMARVMSLIYSLLFWGIWSQSEHPGVSTLRGEPTLPLKKTSSAPVCVLTGLFFCLFSNQMKEKWLNLRLRPGLARVQAQSFNTRQHAAQIREERNSQSVWCCAEVRLCSFFLCWTGDAE